MNTVRDVLEIKGRKVYTTRATATIQEAVEELCRVKVGALLVLDEKGNPAGIISERDLLVRVLLAHKDPTKTRVREIMTCKIVCVDEDHTIKGALALMTHARCRHLPVVRRGVVGMVSMGDLVRATSGDQQYELRVLHDYVEGRYPG